MVKENQQLNLLNDSLESQKPEASVPDTAAIAAAGERRNENYDPNARGVKNRRGSGGGFAAAAAGEINFIDTDDSGVPVKAAKTTQGSINPKGTRSRNQLSAMGKLSADSEPDRVNNPAFWSEGTTPNAEERETGLENIRKIKEEKGW